MSASSGSQFFLERKELDQLIQELRGLGYTTVGPTIDQHAIVYSELTSADQLPVGWTDVQEPGRYELQRRDDNECFGFVVGPHSWKKYLFPPRATVAFAKNGENGWSFSEPDCNEQPAYALIGVRACELAAIGVQDKVFLDGPFVDPIYQARRSKAFIVAVNCTQAAATCFCTSMQTGPHCRSGFDLALTEIRAGFVIEVATSRGKELAGRLPVSAAAADHLDEAAKRRKRAVEQIGRRMDTEGLPELLARNLQNAHWESVAERCLSCTNCTMVCPTCFCSTVEEVSDLDSQSAERVRHWDSCFNPEFSYMNGSVVRDRISSRYRQWLTHKLSTWHDQFGSSGCVGCGRCITWCPPGIDLTEEVAALRRSDVAGADADS